MPAVTNKQIAETLRKALPLIRTRSWDSGERYICYAIEETATAAQWQQRSLPPAITAAKEVIRSRLGHCQTMETWLIKNGVANPYDDFTKLQEHRRAWVKQLIEEFETK